MLFNTLSRIWIGFGNQYTRNYKLPTHFIESLTKLNQDRISGRIAQGIAAKKDSFQLTSDFLHVCDRRDYIQVLLNFQGIFLQVAPFQRSGLFPSVLRTINDSDYCADDT